MIRDEVNTNNGVKRKRFIVPKIVEQINDSLLVNKLIHRHLGLQVK